MAFTNTDNEITLIYNSDDHIGKQVLAYAHTEGIPIRDIDLKNMEFTPTHWVDMAARLKIEVKELVNTENPEFFKKFGLTDQLSVKDWLNLLVHNPTILKGPIVMKGDKIKMMTNPQEMFCFVK